MDAHLAPYLTPEQAALLRYEGALPPGLLAELGARLRDELAALRTLVPEPLARDPAGFQRRSGAFWEGSLLYADLSGFTALTEELTAHGLLGVEELSTIINRLFGALLEELYAYGGMVLKFGGDALTGFFEPAPGGLDHSLAAAAAALAMQRRLAEFASLSAGGRSYRLRLRVGVHRGSPFGAVVGDHRRREVIVTGRAVQRVASLQEQAAPGEVVVSGEALAALSGADSAPQPGGHILRGLPEVALSPAPPLPPLPQGDDLATLGALAARIAQLRPFQPTALPRQVLLPGERAWGEFRPVSALFINVTSLSGVLSLLEAIGRPAAGVLDAYYGHIQRVIHRYGGEINKIDINSVGDKLLAVFGAPVAHEDDPLRAVEAALDLAPALAAANRELRELLDDLLAHGGAGAPIASAALWRTVDLSLRQRVGVATGNVFAGTVGSPRRREYTVIGQVVNLASRLMAAAEPGKVLVAPATARAVGDAVRLEPLPPMALKGFAQRVAASAVLRDDDPPGPARPLAPLVDREAELGLLREQARAALAGAGRVVAVSGEAGIGKSRLVGAFWEELAGRPLARVALSGRAYAQHTPYSVVRDMLAELLGLPEEASPAELWGALGEAVEETAPAFAGLAPLLDAVFAIGPPADAPAPLSRLPQAEQRERLHDLIIALVVGAAQRQPLALLIDDLHWADASSLDLVRRLAQLAGSLPLLLLLAYRSGSLRELPWQGLAHARLIDLEGLGRGASLTLLSHLLDGQPAEGLDPILAQAQGSPFFLEALVRHLTDRGLLRRDAAGAWRLTASLEEASVPETIELLLAAQIDQLDEASRELVQVAAVIGPRIPYRVLAGVYSQARQPARHLVELVRAGILVPDEQGGQTDFHFRQTMLRDVAYQSILYAQRRQLHRRVAERIEIVFALQIERFAAELAHHYLRAEEYALAGTYALRAAQTSQAQHALPEAIASYAMAWEIAQRHPGALGQAAARQAREGLADVAVLAGRYDEAREHYRQLLAEMGPGEGGAASLARAVLARKIGGVYEQQSLFHEALERLHRARRMFEEATGPSRGAPAAPPPAVALELCRIASTIGWVFFRRGEPGRAGQWLDEALAALAEIAEQSDALLEERARLYNRLGGVAWMLGNLPAARAYVERSLADFAALGDLPGHADAQNNLGILAEQLGDWPGAISSYRAALESNQQSGRRRAAAMSLLNLGAAQLQGGEPALALPLLERAAAESATIGDAIHEVMALRWLGRAYTRLGQLDAAGVALGRSLRRARELQLLLEQLDTYTALGELGLARADMGAAAAARSGGEALLDQVDQETLEVGLFLQFAARIEERAGSAPRAAALRARSGDILARLGMPAAPEPTE